MDCSQINNCESIWITAAEYLVPNSASFRSMNSAVFSSEPRHSQSDLNSSLGHYFCCTGDWNAIFWTFNGAQETNSRINYPPLIISSMKTSKRCMNSLAFSTPSLVHRLSASANSSPVSFSNSASRLVTSCHFVDDTYIKSWTVMAQINHTFLMSLLVEQFFDAWMIICQSCWCFIPRKSNANQGGKVYLHTGWPTSLLENEFANKTAVNNIAVV